MSPILVLYLVNFFNAIEHLPRAAAPASVVAQASAGETPRRPPKPPRSSRSIGPCGSGDRTCAVGRSMTLNLREIPLFRAALKSDIVTRC